MTRIDIALMMCAIYLSPHLPNWAGVAAGFAFLIMALILRGEKK